MARSLDISTTSYRNIENGLTKINLDYLFEIAKILSVKVEVLLNFDENKMLNNIHDNASTYNHKKPLESPKKIDFQNSNDLKELVRMLRISHEKAIEMVDKNNLLNAEVKNIVLSVTKLIREVALLQKRKNK